MPDLFENKYTCLKSGAVQPGDRSASIPTGEHAPVQGTPMDFTSEKAIGAEIEADFEQLKLTGGYDHNFILDKAVEGSIELMAVASCKESGITMEAFTDLPCVQFYAGNFIAPVTGKNGVFYDKRNGSAWNLSMCRMPSTRRVRRNRSSRQAILTTPQPYTNSFSKILFL